VPPGEHRVAITGLTDYEDLDRPVTLAAGETTHLELRPRKTSPAAAAVLAPGAAAGISGVVPGDGKAAAAGGGAGGDGGDEAAAKEGEEEEPASKRPGILGFQRDSWYIHLLFGYTWGGFKGSFNGADVSDSFSTLFKGYSDNVPLAMRLGLGATINQNFLLGVDFDNFFEAGKAEQDLSLYGGYGTASSDLTLWIANVNAMVTWFPFGDILYAKFGAGFAYEKVKVSYDDGTNSGGMSQSSKGYGLALGTGVAVGFGKGFHLLFDLQYGKQWFNSDGLDGTWTLALCGGVGWY